MKSIIQVLISFCYFGDAVLLAFAKQILVAMTDNTNFPSPSPTLKVIGNAITDYETAMSNAANGGKTLTAIKNQLREAMLAQLKLLATYVEQNSNNDRAIALSSGFDLRKARGHATVPNTPIGVSAVQGVHNGEISVSCNAQKDAKLYECRYTTDATLATWNSVPPQTNRKFTIGGLAHGADVFVSMRAVNSAGISNWSNAISILVN